MPATNDSPSHALTTVEPPAPTHCTAPRPANFLTHLIATARQVPQARARRRAEPAEAIAAYHETVRKLRASGEPDH